MADNVHRKAHKTTDVNRKLSAPINRTTSETIRIAGLPDNDKNPTMGQIGQLGQHCPPSVNNLTSTPNNNQCRKKTSSFQITSVTVGSRMSNDAGEDSNDDLDESHGEDTSVEHSRIETTDIETPSYSEDTFSKDDVFFNTSNAALSTAPVIPTSSQYGLAIVPSEPSGNASNSSNDSNINALELASVTDNNIINLLSSNTKQDTDGVSIRDGVSHGRNERFKVVKIESTEPFKRGRWTCMDYLDHTSSNNQTAINSAKTIDPNQVCISYGVNDANLPLNQEEKNMDMNGHANHQDIHGSIGLSNNQSGYNVGSLQSQNCQRNQAGLISQPYYANQNQASPSQGVTLPNNLQPNHANNLGQPQSMPQVSIPIITQSNNVNNTVNSQVLSHKDGNPGQNQVCQSGGQNQGVCQTGTQNQGCQTGSQNQVCQAGAPNQVCQSGAPNQVCQSGGQNQGVCQSGGQNQVCQSPAQNQVCQSGAPANSPNIMVQSPNQAQTQTTPHQINDPIATIQRIQRMQKLHPQVSQSGGHAGGTSPAQQTTASGGTGAASDIQGNQGTMGLVRTGGQEGTEQDSVSGIADAALLECLAEVTQATDEHKNLEESERFIFFLIGGFLGNQGGRSGKGNILIFMILN